LIAWMIGLPVIDEKACADIVDDFLAGHQRRATGSLEA